MFLFKNSCKSIITRIRSIAIGGAVKLGTLLQSLSLSSKKASLPGYASVSE